MADFRDTIIDRLHEDLVGPTGGRLDEIIDERPSDRYLTGILYPQRTAVGQEQDEGMGAGAAEDDETALEQVAVSHTLRPANAGMSFAVAGPAARLKFRVQCGRYEQVEGAEAEEAAPTAAAEQGGAEDKAASSPPRKARTTRWRRIDHDVVVDEDPRTTPRVDLAAHGVPGLSLVLQCAPRGAEWLVTAVLVNENTIAEGESRLASDEKAFYQVRLTAEPLDGARLPARPSRRAALDEDGRSAALLYRDALEFAVGHTCSADWELAPDGTSASRVCTTWLPRAKVDATSSKGGEAFVQLAGSDAGTCFDAEVLASDEANLGHLLAPVPAAYETWIAQQRDRVASLPEDHREQARKHLDEGCATCLQRMRAGIALLERDADIALAFRLANRAMAMQFRWKEQTKLEWRPFQLGFLLLTIESVADRRHADRETMDLLWFPTGGGKTEAYLGLVAFTLFYRRLRNGGHPERGAGTAAIMRYTLRLLTTQQFQRAAALVLACELLRRQGVLPEERLGSTPFSIGLWVGTDAVANSVAEALKALVDNENNRPDQVTHCPLCNTLLQWGPGPARRYVQVKCPNDACALASHELPIWTVDEDVYERMPSLIIGTIDKFAQLPRKPVAGRMFGLDVPHDAPDLIIQDELHLISGPLGTLAGLFETAIDELCSREGVRPKAIGSTATIRRATEQIRALFDRSAQLFPPPGLDASDSCFAVRNPDAPPRRYVAISTAGRSAKFTLQAVSASLLQSASRLLDGEATADAYWTLVEYFNALRELGGALVLMQDDVPASIEQFAKRRGEDARDVRIVAELTSRLSQSELKDRLKELELRVGSGAAVDVLLATNMISVGIDIARLGVMVMNGQPKAVAEYIQATSRVGRSSVPGLVVAIYNNGKARDRSRFETFRTWHETLYREVEATSVTPFSSRARDRGLRAVLVTLARLSIPALKNHPQLGDAVDEVQQLLETIVKRACDVELEETDATREQLENALREWETRGSLECYFNDHRPATALMVSAEHAATRRAARKELGDAWPIPSSMRNVEPMTKVSLIEKLAVERDEEDDE
jgi:hypothetical protein